MAKVDLGDLFAVPLKSGGYGIGVIARMKKGRGAKSIVGYFFDLKLDNIPEPSDLSDIGHSQVRYITQFGDLGLHEDRWPIIGPMPNWDQEDWPMPVFGKVMLDGVRAEKVYYDPSNPEKWTNFEPCAIEEARALPQDGLAGARAIETVLDKILNDPELDELAGHKIPGRLVPVEECRP